MKKQISTWSLLIMINFHAIIPHLVIDEEASFKSHVVWSEKKLDFVLMNVSMDMHN